MENSKKMVRMILVGMVLTAIIVGIVYYYHETQREPISKKGTLIVSSDVGWNYLWYQ